MSSFVYFLPLTEIQMSDPLKAQLLSWLSEEELARVKKITRSLVRQTQALYVRSALRMVLSRHAQLTPQQWLFDYGAQGKPALIDAQYLITGLSFNISHSGEWLMIGIMKQATTGLTLADKPLLGVDIERTRPKTDIHSILNHYFSAQETAQLVVLDEPYQRQRFFDLWSIKESYIKAEGSGLALSLKSFSVNFAEQQSTQVQLINLSVQQESPLTTLNVVEQVAIDVDSTHQFSHNRNIYRADNWQVFMGRLNQTYRFAVSVNQALSPTSAQCTVNNNHSVEVDWKLYQFDWQVLLKDNDLIFVG